MALAILGFSVAVAGVILAIMFWPSDWTFLGIGGVNVRHVWTRYDSDEIADALAHRNLIIVTRHADIEIRVRKFEQFDVQDNRGSISLFENARGLTFNNIHRSHVSLTQTRIDGVIFYQIYVSAPSGIVTRDARVYINLVGDEDYATGAPYNIILDTGARRVNWNADAAVEHKFMDSLTIRPSSIGPISFPAPPTAAYPFHITLDNLTVNSNNARVNIPTPVTGDVLVQSRHGSVTVGAAGTLSVPASTNINVSAGSVDGDVYFNSTSGSLRITDVSGGIGGDLDFVTNNAALNISNIAGRVDFSVNVASSMTIGTATGLINGTFVSGGTLNVTNSHSNVDIESRAANITIGGTGTAQGARGPIHINNRYGATMINFARDTIGQPSLTFNGYDGNITATRIAGLVDITIQSGGRAQIATSFAQVVQGVGSIRFLGSAAPNTNFGNVTVTLLRQGTTPFTGFNLEVLGTARARDHTGWPNAQGSGNTQTGIEIPNWNAIDGMSWPVSGGDVTRLLRVYTSNNVWLRTAAW